MEHGIWLIRFNKHEKQLPRWILENSRTRELHFVHNVNMVDCPLVRTHYCDERRVCSIEVEGVLEIIAGRATITHGEAQA